MMKKTNTRFKTYKRRTVTKDSGYHVCESSTGAECIITKSDRYVTNRKLEIFEFKRSNLKLIELFKNNISILAFSGCVKTQKQVYIKYEISIKHNNTITKYTSPYKEITSPKTWKSIGYHKEIQLTKNNDIVEEASIKIHIVGPKNNKFEFVCVDFDIVNKDEYKTKKLKTFFYQKTKLSIPYVYYLNTQQSTNKFLVSKQKFDKGDTIILKSCNRCGRFLPIDLTNEENILAYGHHCVKNAPCTHPSFRSYKIINKSDLDDNTLTRYKIIDNQIISYYGHQLECKACKKFFVNAPLNPQRTTQQHREDNLRRRAIEALVNSLENRNLVHFEFKEKTKTEFSNAIWNKFDRKCFKCGKSITLKEMNLDHTMPLAYLYRLDESATCLCDACNSQKSDKFPIDFYTKNQLRELSKITGLSMKKLKSKKINSKILNLLVKNIVWFYDEFLMEPDYQKKHDGIKESDKINSALYRVIGNKIDLIEEYYKITNHYPRSVSK